MQQTVLNWPCRDFIFNDNISIVILVTGCNKPPKHLGNCIFSEKRQNSFGKGLFSAVSQNIFCASFGKQGIKPVFVQ